MSLMDELSAARRVLARMGPEAFLNALDGTDHQALTAEVVKTIVAEPYLFTQGLTQGERVTLRNVLRDAIDGGCNAPGGGCRAHAGRNERCEPHAYEYDQQQARIAAEIRAARPRRSLTPGPNGCCYRSADGVACPNTGTENVGGVAACDAHARQLPGAAERRSMRPYT